MLATNVNRGYTPESLKSSLAFLSCSLASKIATVTTCREFIKLQIKTFEEEMG
jgi:hypothetical protein